MADKPIPDIIGFLQIDNNLSLFIEELSKQINREIVLQSGNSTIPKQQTDSKSTDGQPSNSTNPDSKRKSTDVKGHESDEQHNKKTKRIRYPKPEEVFNQKSKMYKLCNLYLKEISNIIKKIGDDTLIYYSEKLCTIKFNKQYSTDNINYVISFLKLAYERICDNISFIGNYRDYYFKTSLSIKSQYITAKLIQRSSKCKYFNFYCSLNLFNHRGDSVMYDLGNILSCFLVLLQEYVNLVNNVDKFLY